MIWSSRCDLVCVCNTNNHRSSQISNFPYSYRMEHKSYGIVRRTNAHILLFYWIINTRITCKFEMFFCDNLKTILTYSGDAMKVPSNLYLYVITAGITNETARYDANTALVHLVNFQIIIWIIVPQITNWKSAAKYHACCIHCKYLFDKISWKLFALSVVTYRFTAADEIVDV